MKKVRCPQCAVINLDKFVTYPHCAGCGALLPQIETSADAVSAWRRPLGPLLWATIVGCAAIGLIAAAVLLVPQPAESGKLIVYAQTQRITQVGNTLVVRLTIDSIGDTAARDDPALHGIKFRVPQEFFNKFALVSLEPRPDEVTNFGKGRYFYYGSLPRETQLRFTLRALQAGRHRLTTTIYAQQQLPTDYLATIRVLGNLKKRG